MSKRKFTWECWDFDIDGYAYVVSCDECPDKKDFVKYIAKHDFHWEGIGTLNPDANVYEEGETWLSRA